MINIDYMDLKITFNTAIVYRNAFVKGNIFVKRNRRIFPFLVFINIFEPKTSREKIYALVN